MSNAIHRLVSVKGFSTCLFAAVGLFLSPMSANSASSGTALDYPTWHLPRGATVRLGKGRIGHTDRAVAFSPDGKLVAVASGIGVWLYTVENPERFSLLPSGVVNSLCFSSDGRTLASGGGWRENSEVRLWDVATETNTTTVTVQTSSPIYLSLSPDGKSFSFYAGRGVIERLDVDTGRLTSALVGDWSFSPSMSLSPDGKTIASGIEDGTIILWDVATRTKTATLRGHQWEVNSVSFSPDGRILASASGDGTVKLWDVATRTISATLPEQGSGIYAVAFSPTGSTFATGAYNGSVKIWRTTTVRNIATFNRHTDGVRAVSFSPGGATLATASENGDVFLWNLATGNSTAISGYMGDVWGMAFSPDSATLASRTAAANGKVDIWDAETGRMEGTLRGHDSGVRSISISPDRTKLASASLDRRSGCGTWTRTDASTRSHTIFQSHPFPFHPMGRPSLRGTSKEMSTSGT